MDAISINTCGPVTFSGSLLDSIFGSSYDNGCTGLPEELETFGPTVAHNSGLWINGYQTDYAPLHSAPSSFADENIHWQRLDGGFHPMGQHAATETDSQVWATVEHYVRSVLAP
jgi:hypothetical protein